MEDVFFLRKLKLTLTGVKTNNKNIKIGKGRSVARKFTIFIVKPKN